MHHLLWFSFCDVLLGVWKSRRRTVSRPGSHVYSLVWQGQGSSMSISRTPVKAVPLENLYTLIKWKGIRYQAETTNDYQINRKKKYKQEQSSTNRSRKRGFQHSFHNCWLSICRVWDTLLTKEQDFFFFFHIGACQWGIHYEKRLSAFGGHFTLRQSIHVYVPVTFLLIL